MYSPLQIAIKYLNYYLTSSNGKGHGIHSPFIFHFIKKILNDKYHYPEYDSIEDLRKKLLCEQTLLTVEDLGAGSSADKNSQRTVASIAKNAAKPKKYGQLLFRMVKEYKPKTILEFGTSLGITTSYLTSANKDAEVITMEGAAAVADYADNNFKLLNSPGSRTGIQLVRGNFDHTLSDVLSSLSSVDFVFIDGNHRQEPTEKYFQQLLSKTNNDSILIFDDIHWSEEMERAWKSIQQAPAVRCSIDLFFIGIVLFRSEFKEKQHFVIRF